MRDIRVAFTLEQCWHKVPGGTAVAGIEMARAISRIEGIELIGVAAKHDEPPPDPWKPPIPVAHLGVSRLLMYEGWHRLRRPAVQKATGDVDVIHATTIAIPPRTAPLVVTIHDLTFLTHPRSFTKRGISFFRKGLRHAWRNADLILCPSRATMNACRDNGFEEARLRLVPMGVEVVPASEDEVATVRARFGLDRPYILWSGTIEPRKNLHRLLKAYGTLAPDQELVLVGPKGWNENIERMLAGQRPDIKILGFVASDELRALYAGADVFCYPSLEEGFGLPVLEAMAQSTPVVTSRATSTEELGRDAAVLVNPKSSDSIMEGLRKVLEDQTLAQRLKAAGKKRAASYPWSRTAELTVAAYREVAP
jgi:glycosyltransferase involved in cell wall biosynthesis